MQCITKRLDCQQRWGSTVHAIAVLGLVLLAVNGIILESSGGWIACPPVLIREAGQEQHRKRQRLNGFAWQAGWAWMKRSWVVVAVRSEVVLLLVFLTGRWEWQGLCLLPWVIWSWKGLGVAWPGLGKHPLYQGVGHLLEEAGRLALLGLVLLWLAEELATLEARGSYAVLVWGGVSQEPRVEAEEDEEGWIHVQFRGEFELHLDGNVEFYKRMLIIFLGLLEVPGERRRSRRTRDGRTPFVRQQQMAAWLGIPQPHISRWCNYWLNQDWRRMLSQRMGDVLTLEVQQGVLDTWVLFPWWGAERLWKHLKARGEGIALSQVRQVARESGWSTLRRALRRVYAISPDSFRPRDEWLVGQLLAQIEALVAQVEMVGRLTSEQEIELADLQAFCQELNLCPATARRPLPWVAQLERLLFGHWEPVEDEAVRCLYCGTTDVARKSRKPRLKKYVDEQGELQAVEVCRYYCHNPKCPYKTFTNLPPHLVPYSCWTVNHHLAALQLYEWSHSVYRCTALMLGVSRMTAYRWVSGFGHELLPIAALFGVVRCSGVVGVDEKYVLVPKNDKPEGKMKRWMYVYLAVDCHTYDLLHIELYPYNTKQSATAFLLALRAKGYHPRVVVTDMRVDYGPLIAQVFPKATHQECIFHALQEVHKQIKEIYGSDYAETHPDVEMLREEIEQIFAVRTKRTARRRYEQVLAQRKHFVTETPEAEALFAFLERHWPKLVHAIESRIIPTTNNTTEEVIRIFNQHYKTFCGFENIESARLYLAVFEKVYRFTPFSADAQERIRGKCPLELAGYEVQKLPMAQLLRGLTLQWPTSAFKGLVPNV
jgi:transposase-like protein